MSTRQLRVQYHGPSGEWEGVWPNDTQDDFEHVVFKGRKYKIAGTQDGVMHFKEIVVREA